MNPTQPTPAPLHDIAGPVPFASHEVIWIVAGSVVGLILLGLVIWMFVRNWRKPARTPLQVALSELALLRGEIGSGEPYAFAVKVSDVLRQYLAKGRGLPAGSQTSMEFLETVRARNAFNEDERAALAAFLEKADLIKFARWHASQEDCSELVDSAERLVRSQPQPETAEVAR